MSTAKVKAALLLLLILIAVILLPQSVRAATQIGLKPSKSKEIHLEDSLSIAEEKSIEYLVVNLTEEEKMLKFRIAQIDDVDSSGKITYRNETASPSGIVNFITLDQSEITIKPSERQYINLALKIPDNTEAGEFLGGLIVEDQGRQQLAVSKLNILVEGDLTKSLEASFTSEIVNEKINLHFTLENTGNTKIKNGVISIIVANTKLQNIFKINRESIVPIDAEILPNSTIKITKELDQKTDVIGDYKIFAEVSYGGLTPLKLEEEISYTSSKRLTVYSVVAGVILVGVLVLLVLFLRWFMNKRRKVKLVNCKWDQIVQDLISGKVTNTPVAARQDVLSKEDIDEIVGNLKEELTQTIKQELQAAQKEVNVKTQKQIKDKPIHKKTTTKIKKAKPKNKSKSKQIKPKKKIRPIILKAKKIKVDQIPKTNFQSQNLELLTDKLKEAMVEAARELGY